MFRFGLREAFLPRAALAALIALVAFGGHARAAEGPGLAGSRQEAARRSLVGTWTAPVGGQTVTLRMAPDGTCLLDGQPGSYRLDGGALVLTVGGREVKHAAELGGNRLKLSGGDLAAPLEFTRQPEVGDLVRTVLGLESAALTPRLVRIGVVVLIVVLSRLFIWLLHAVSRWVVFSTWGPLRFLYRRRKNRALTLHSVALNLAKYVVYFTALGYVLGELGVNYTAYLASLSVVGLAVGFGSQGLVQDMVTGFFVIFEGQFDVGDMVQISGQTGRVEELGLRMTRLRDYQGAAVVIPNRNISVVGNFAGGAQRATLDVPVPGGEGTAAAELPGLLAGIAGEVAGEFAGVVLSAPEVSGPEPSAEGAASRYVRVSLGIWPGQQWVVEGQLLPRIREALAARDLPAPPERLAVFYRGPEERTVRGPSRPAASEESG
jgi:small conductance mechanosensitive channel